MISPRLEERIDRMATKAADKDTGMAAIALAILALAQAVQEHANATRSRR
jgi:hypothetical protein